mmetsp:Transcript_11697/g.36074  ORF Transcript_11697/g.36074 Transcript_11697/m.36074 type:complete len:100 (+) Transcript_11697:1853-2152(+)
MKTYAASDVPTLVLCNRFGKTHMDLYATSAISGDASPDRFVDLPLIVAVFCLFLLLPSSRAARAQDPSRQGRPDASQIRVETFWRTTPPVICLKSTVRA